MLSELLGLERNHYDRLVHFLYGVLMFLPSTEVLPVVFLMPVGSERSASCRC